MKRAAIALAAVAILTTGVAVQAQTFVPTPQMLMPNPLGIVIMAGQWVYNSYNDERTFFIEVEGIGPTTNDSVNNAYRLAVEQSVGTQVASVSEATNGRLTTDKTATYARGMVDKYQQVSQTYDGVNYHTRMKVWVKDKLTTIEIKADEPKVAKLDGPRVGTQIQTIDTTRFQQKDFVKTVLPQAFSDFTENAYRVEMTKQKLSVVNGVPVLSVKYEAEWNQDWLKNLWKSIKDTSDYVGNEGCQSGNCNYQYRIGMYGGFYPVRTWGGIVNWQTDPTAINYMESHLRSPAIKLTLRSTGGQVLWEDIITPSPDYNNQRAPWFWSVNTPSQYGDKYNRQLFIKNNYTHKDEIQIAINPDYVKDLGSVEMEIATPYNTRGLKKVGWISYYNGFRADGRHNLGTTCNRNTGYVQDLAGGAPEC